MRLPTVATVTIDIAALIGALVWPAVLLILAIMYRDAIRDAAHAALRRGFKVGLPGGWSFELPGASEASLEWVGGKAEVDLRRPISSAAIVDSTRAEFSAQLMNRTPAEYAKVDLGNGQEWLTSRLYFMAIALQRLRGLGALVFVTSSAGGSGLLVGWAQIAHVRWALANRFPQLERAFLEASDELVDQWNLLLMQGGAQFAPPVEPPSTASGPVPEDSPAYLLEGFLRHIQRPESPLLEQSVEWVPLVDTASTPPASRMYEFGQWLNSSLLQEVLSSRLITASIRENELLAKTEAEQGRLIAAHRGRYVALTHDDGRFSRLINRDTLMQEVAVATLRQQSPVP
jgi:hypothetical protein